MRWRGLWPWCQFFCYTIAAYLGAPMPGVAGSRHSCSTMNLLRITHGTTQTASVVRLSVARHLQGQLRARQRDKTAAFMAESQVPWGLDALTGSVTQAAWKTKPSWYLVATDDHMIPPDQQRFMSKRAGATVVETKGSHALYVSRPAPVAALIKQAAATITTTASK